LRFPIRRWRGGSALFRYPAEVVGAPALVTIAYLVAVYGVKRWFFAHDKLS